MHTRLSIAIASAALTAFVALTLVLWIDARRPVTITIAPQAPAPVTAAITGAVVTPGVYTLAPDGRLADLIDAAGGLTTTADVANLNINGRVGDGETIDIPRLVIVRDEQNLLLDINTASAAELDQLPGIGPTLSERIVAWRLANGPYHHLDDLLQIDGISENLLEKIRPFITVAP